MRLGNTRRRSSRSSPDAHAAIVAELASHEQSGLLNIGPKRNRWRELQAFEGQLVEIERRR
jgi:hypothetical protein